ncbi:hypothetical protein [Cronobacter muytjensii]|uniref:tail fiber/spike domain-containing protein n=1 Tax=Cronobacter muytjensii TaxID=413501 RepID=UPI003CEEEF28
MATQPTNLPVPSESPRDLKFNAGKIDEFVTSLVTTYIDRFGNEHYTIEGLNQLARQAIAAFGWIPVGTFQAGATISLPNQILKDTSSGEYYRWDGSLPKIVPAGSTPASTGGTGVGAWISVGDSALRSMLAATTGAGLVGYSASVTYPAGTVGEALGPFVATGGTRKVSKEDRAGAQLNIYDFLEFSTDAGAATNKAIARLRSEANANYPDQAGGVVNIPRGRLPAATSIPIDLIPGIGGIGISLKGQGTAASFIDFQGSAVDGIIGSAAAGPLYGEIRGITFANLRSAIRLEKGSRLKISGVEGYVTSSDSFKFDNFIMSELSNSFSTASKSHGFNYSPEVTTASVYYEKTSIFHHNNWSRKAKGHGHLLGNMSYSVSMANGADECDYAGYYISGVSYGLTSIGDGAESCMQSGWIVDATRATDDIKNYRITGCYGRNNNRAGGNASLIGVKAGNGGKATVIIDGVVNKPQAGVAGGECVIVNGDGAIARLHGNSDLPNGFRSLNGGYIDYTPVTIISKKTIPLSSSGVSICGLKSSQGYVNRYAGEIAVVARNLHPSGGTVAERLAIYKLMVCKSDSGSPLITVITSLGYTSSASGTGDKSDYPAFTWSLNSTSNTLVAVPQAGVGGKDFYFEIETSRTLCATNI